MDALGTGVNVGSSRVVEEISRALAAARDGRYAGRDPGRLATVEVDGGGLVTAVRLVPVVMRQRAAVIARAVLLAYLEAEACRVAALQEAVRSLRAGEQAG